MDFACKSFSIDEVVRCSLSLTKAEFKVLEFLIKNDLNKFKSDHIAKVLNLDISTTQRCLKKLNEKNIVSRSQFNLLKGGYVYAYKITDKKQIKQIISDIIAKWADKFHKEIDKW